MDCWQNYGLRDGHGESCMKIGLVEYLNYVNKDGKPIGHGKKVLSEAGKMFEADEVRMICSDAYRSDFMKEAKRCEVKLPEISQKETGIKLNEAVFRNIIKTFSVAEKEEILWFTNTEWRLFAILPFVAKNKKVVVTCYRDVISDICNSNARLKQLKLHLVKRGVERADLIVVTNQHLSLSDNQIFVPDYMYTEFYKKYDTIKKGNRVLCVGAMRESKDLRGVVKLFSNSDIPVYIVGGFSDKQEYSWLVTHKTENITIEDRIVPYDEYYRLIAESKYVIIPYKMEAYDMATSGILQETMFLKSIPIAPRKLLEFNGISGIGYNNLSEIPIDMDTLNQQAKKVKFDMHEYEEQNIKNKIATAFEQL